MNSYTLQKILVPIDLSETSLNALDAAVAIAKKHKATIHLLNIIEKNFHSFQDEGGVVNVPDKSNSVDVLNALAGAMEHTHHLSFDVIQEAGNVADTIIRISILLQTDLITIGTHGASGVRNGFIGSNSYRVIKESICPVLTIPPKRKFHSFKKALFPIRPVSGALYPYEIVRHFLSSQSTIDILGLWQKPVERETHVLEKIVDEIKDKLEINKSNVNIAWGMGYNIADDVLQHVQQNNSDLIIVTSVLDVTIKPRFIGPHSQKIVNCSKVPVLSLKKIVVPAFG